MFYGGFIVIYYGSDMFVTATIELSDLFKCIQAIAIYVQHDIKV